MTPPRSSVLRTRIALAIALAAASIVAPTASEPERVTVLTTHT